MTTTPGSSADDRQVQVQVSLEQDARAPGQARRAARAVLLGWRLPTLVDVVVLAVSELVTNAVRHGRPPVGLELRRDRAWVRVGVHDAEAAPPPADRPTAGARAESGRGLDIVEALAVEVGCEQVPGDGKVIYAWFGGPAGDGSAPRC